MKIMIKFLLRGFEGDYFMINVFSVYSDKVTLREITPSDIENYVNWYFYDKEWEEWDAPWERLEFKEEEIKIFFFSKMLKERQKEVKNFLQIVTNKGKPIGWVSSYFIKGDKEKLAVGITIPPVEERGKGYGEDAIKAYIKYLSGYYKKIYMETWSGNERMMNVAKKIGFCEINREENFWENNGLNYDGVTYLLDLEVFLNEQKII